jgi:oligo-1,6-glucosidase
MVSRFGNDSPAFRDLSSKMLSTFIMTMRGTPYYYNGDELGMTNAGFDKIEDYRDMPTLNEYQNQKNIGGDIPKFIKRIQFESRDNGRTPFQWDNSVNAGFTKGNPWIKTNPNYTNINAKAQENDPNSCLNFFRKLVALRKDNLGLVYGKYTLLDKNNPNVYAYTREFEGHKFLILLNFSSANASANISSITTKSIVLNNYKTSPKGIKAGSITLRPYESIIYRL